MASTPIPRCLSSRYMDVCLSLSINFRPLVVGKGGGQIVSQTSVHRLNLLSMFSPFYYFLFFPCLPFTCSACWEDHLLPLLILIPHELQTVAFFDIHPLPRFFHLSPIVYRWLFYFSFCCRLIPFKHSLTIVKEFKEEEICLLASETVENHFNECTIFHFLKGFIYLFLERGKGRRKREKYQCVVASHAPSIGDLACNPSMCPDWESNQRPFGLQARAQSTEPHQLGHSILFCWCTVFYLFKKYSVDEIQFHPNFNSCKQLYNEQV